MREDHLIDAPEWYAHRLRAGAVNVAVGGWAMAACVVLSMVELPAPHAYPIARSALITLLLALTAGALLLWAKGWWRLTDARVEALPARSVVVSGVLVRTGLVLGLIGAAAWATAASVRAVAHPHDDTLALLLARTAPALVPIGVVTVLATAYGATQHAVHALRQRTAPAGPGVFALPFTLATLPVGLVTLPGAMNRPSAIAFATMALALAFAFHGAQGAILRHRIARILRERRRAEVLANREPDPR